MKKKSRRGRKFIFCYGNLKTQIFVFETLRDVIYKRKISEAYKLKRNLLKIYSRKALRKQFSTVTKQRIR